MQVERVKGRRAILPGPPDPIICGRLLSMRFEGKLKSWHEDRGFGFIAPLQGGQEIFLHISAFPRDGSKPRLNELLSFEVELNREGKKRALNVRRPAPVASAMARRPSRMPAQANPKNLRNVIVVALMVALGVYAYKNYLHRVATPVQAEDAGSTQAPPKQPLDARCDGRVRCSQMTSCAEANFFLKNCPGVEMDGNHDGVPCEQQWCTGSINR